MDIFRGRPSSLRLQINRIGKFKSSQLNTIDSLVNCLKFGISGLQSNHSANYKSIQSETLNHHCSVRECFLNVELFFKNDLNALTNILKKNNKLERQGLNYEFLSKSKKIVIFRKFTIFFLLCFIIFSDKKSFF
ncbi:hypothetical protein BpHYR1_043094 [Brachionus plicatilis]|uniref:Uncharacterized protein n=1 Tax=Brachionus plicatilis TaxID=10195 RepID=A0A3M7T2F1_BRAPC|nr:hypothetical protein BpHYR1_043094 [Brachionus plicatilis]